MPLDQARFMREFNETHREEFNPELLNRIDEIVVFEKLRMDDTEKIASIMLNELVKLCNDIGISIEFDTSVPKYIAERGYDKLYGARPLRRTIMSIIENPLSEKIITQEIKNGDRVSVFCENGKIKFKCYANK